MRLRSRAREEICFAPSFDVSHMQIFVQVNLLRPSGRGSFDALFPQPYGLNKEFAHGEHESRILVFFGHLRVVFARKRGGR
jgi:hypothetical protein